MEQQSQAISDVRGTRRRASQRAVCALLACCTVVGLSPTRALAQTEEAPAIYTYAGADRGERLIAKAREEGSLTLYTSIATTESAPLARAFESKYGVKVQLWRALSENVVQRALTESRGGRHGMDVVETNAPEVEALVGRPQAIALAKNAAHPHAALLFADFMLSPEGQKLLADLGRIPSSRTQRTLLDQYRHVMVDPVKWLNEAPKWQQVWTELFLK